MWTKKEREILQDLFNSAIGSDNTDYILEKLSEIYNIIWSTQIEQLYAIDMNIGKIHHIGDNEKTWKLVAIEKESEK